MKLMINKFILVASLSLFTCAHTAYAGVIDSARSMVFNKKTAAVGALLVAGYYTYKYATSEKGCETLFGKGPSVQARDAYGRSLDTKGKEGLLPRWWRYLRGMFTRDAQ